MGFQKVAEIIHDVTKTYGGQKCLYKKYDSDGGTDNSYLESSTKHKWIKGTELIGVGQEEFKEEDHLAIGTGRKLDLIFNVSSLELIEKNVVIPDITEKINDILIYKGVPYTIVKVKFHELQEIQLYRIFGQVRKDKIKSSDPDHKRLLESRQ